MGSIGLQCTYLRNAIFLRLFTDLKVSGFFSIFEVIDIIKSSTPLYMGIQYIFTFLSLGFLTSLLDMEEMFEDAAFENRSAPYVALI